MASQCRLCSENSFKTIIWEGEWQYIQCGHCGLVFLHPQPSSPFLYQHYQEYLPENTEEVEAWRHLMKQVFEKTALLIEDRISSPGKLLDVGCGYGFFLDYMAGRGWEGEGIEISATGRHFAQRNLGLNVSAHSLPRADLPDARYDLVTLFYVIEHLVDPVGTLQEVRRLLRPGGLLLLRWPHTTPIVRLLKPWVSSLKLYQAPSHLFDFSPKTIYRMLNHLGFEGIRTTICGWTRPPTRGACVASEAFGFVGENLARLSKDRWLLPGVSKTTLAQRTSLL